MEQAIQDIIERTARYRKQLAELEAKRARYGSNVPPELWNELVEISRLLDLEERKAQEAGSLKSRQVNYTRVEIITTLDKYNHWRERIREVGQMFLACIVRPGYRLKQAVQHVQYLEGEYRRIRRCIENESYASLEELEGDIRRVLTHSDTSFEADQQSFEDEVLKEKEKLVMPEDIDVDEMVDDFKKDRLVRDFKRIVLPAVHPDTSDTPAEIFKNVFEVYEQRDFILMEAYTIQYRGEINPDPDGDPIEFLENASTYQDDYGRLLGRLQRRVDHLMKDLTPQELEDPEQLQIEFEQQREEIRERTQAESEKILHLRDLIESLIQLYLKRKSRGIEAT